MRNERNLGIDALRIISMGMVVLLHTLGVGGILWQAEILSAHYEISWALEIVSYCAVNCFALITGYVMYENRFKVSRGVSVWVQTLFYTVTITLVFAIFHFSGVSVGKKDWVSAFLPVLSKQYWYVTAYMGIFFFIPYLNKLIKSLDKRQATYLIIIVLLLFSVGDMFAKILFGEFTYLEDGYNAFWLAILYLVGAYIRKYNISAKITRKRALLGFITMAGITWLIKLFADLFTHRFADLEWGSRISNAVIDYTSPFIFFEAVFLFVLFANWQVQNRTCKKMICFFAPISFGVYLINTNNYVFDILLPGAFSSYLQFSLIAFIPVILLTVFLQYIVLALIEKGRLLLFQRCRLNEIIRKADWLPQWVESKWDKRKISQ